MFLEHKARNWQIPARLERNSLVMDVKVCEIRAEETEAAKERTDVAKKKDELH